MFINKIHVILLILFSLQLSADQPKNIRLVDRICAVVGVGNDEQPILESDVRKRAEENSISLADAQHELLGERALRLYAQTQPTISLADVRKDAQENTKRIMQSNNITKPELEKILMNHYKTTLPQWEYEIESKILISRVEAQQASAIDISERKIKEEHAKQLRDKNKEISIVFISVTPVTKAANKSASLSAEFSKANLIKQDILSNISLNKLKKKYNDDPTVSFVGPTDYKEGTLIQQYDTELKKEPAAIVTRPFKASQANNAVMMIWKIEKPESLDNQATALENVEKGIYREEGQRRRNAIEKNVLAKSTVEINCEW